MIHQSRRFDVTKAMTAGALAREIGLGNLQECARLIGLHREACTGQAAIRELENLKDGHRRFLEGDFDARRLCGIEDWGQ